jgi:hypothetical protein
MDPLHDPPPGLDPRLLLDGLGFLAARQDMGGTAELAQGGTDLLLIVALVQARALRLLLAGFGPGDDDALQGGADQLHVRAVGAGLCQAQGDAMPLGEDAAFAPTLAAVGRIRAGLVTAERRFDHGAIPRQPVPIDPSQFVKLLHPGAPKLAKDARAHPCLKAVMRSGVGAQVCLVQGLPLTARAQHIEDGIGTHPIRDTGASAPEPVRVDVRREQRLSTAHRASETRKPVVVRLFGVRLRSRFWCSCLFIPSVYRISGLFG